jgi:hypothetical protein
MDGGYTGEDKGGDWVQKTFGWSVEIVSRPRKAAPKEVLMVWAREWAKEGVKVDWQKLMPPEGFRRLATSVGRREDVFVDRPEQEDEQGLRAAHCHERSIHLRSYDPRDGEAFGPCSIVFGQFLNGVLGSSPFLL